MGGFDVHIASRALDVDASGIRKVFELGRQRRMAAGGGFVDLSIGQPDYDVPDCIKQQAIEAINAGFNGYTVTQGIGELCDALNEKVVGDLDWRPQTVMVTSGVSGGLLLALLATIEPGDEAIIIDPYFVMYKHLVHLVGGRAVIVSSYPDFRLPVEAIASAITDRTRVILVNSPSNPTGCVYTDGELKRLAELAVRSDLLIISDEIYRSLTYDGPIASVTRYAPDHTLYLDGFSKSHGMTGWRIGYAAGPQCLIEQMTKLQQYTFVCAPSFVQKAALEALNCSMEDKVQEYRHKRDLVYRRLSESFQVVKPGGGFYIFPQVPDGDANKFVEKAIEKDVLVIPGNVFSQRNSHFRISYARVEAELQAGLQRLCDLAR